MTIKCGTHAHRVCLRSIYHCYLSACRSPDQLLLLKYKLNHRLIKAKTSKALGTVASTIEVSNGGIPPLANKAVLDHLASV